MSAAGQIRSNTLRALEQPSVSYPLARPILLVLNATLSHIDPPHVDVIEDPAGLKFQVNLSPKLDPESRIFRRTIIRTLLLDLALRRQPSIPDHLPEPPRWMVDALYHVLQNSDNLMATGSAPRGSSGKIPPLASLLTRPDSASEPSSPEDESLAASILSLLMQQPDAGASIVRLIPGTSDKSVAVGKLLKSFPSLGSEAELEKQWTLHLATLEAQAERVVMTGPQTLIELNKLLELEGVDSKGNHFKYGLDQFSDFIRMPGIDGMLKARHLEFLSLASRGHFFYGPALGLYVEASAELAAGRTAGVAARFKKAAQLKEEARRRLEEISDYLNWFEAEKAPYQRPAWISEIYRLWSQNWPPPKDPDVTKALDEWEKRIEQQTEEDEIKRALQEAGARSKKQP